MKAQEAVVVRILTIMREKNMSLSKLSARSGVAKSVLHGTLTGKPPRVRNTSIVTIQRLCQAFDMTLRDFFDDAIFTNVEYYEDDERL